MHCSIAPLKKILKQRKFASWYNPQMNAVEMCIPIDLSSSSISLYSYDLSCSDFMNFFSEISCPQPVPIYPQIETAVQPGIYLDGSFPIKLLLMSSLEGFWVYYNTILGRLLMTL